MQTITCRASSDRLKIHCADGIITFAVSGVIGLTEALGAMDRVHREVRASQPRAVVLDIRRIVLTMGPACYVEFVRAALQRPITLPVAYIAPKALMPLTLAHETLMRRRNLSRRFFGCEASAHRWLARLPQATPDLLG